MKSKFSLDSVGPWAQWFPSPSTVDSDRDGNEVFSPCHCWNTFLPDTLWGRGSRAQGRRNMLRHRLLHICPEASQTPTEPGVNTAPHLRFSVISGGIVAIMVCEPMTTNKDAQRERAKRQTCLGGCVSLCRGHWKGRIFCVQEVLWLSLSQLSPSLCFCQGGQPSWIFQDSPRCLIWVSVSSRTLWNMTFVTNLKGWSQIGTKQGPVERTWHNSAWYRRKVTCWIWFRRQLHGPQPADCFHFWIFQDYTQDFSPCWLTVFISKSSVPIPPHPTHWAIFRTKREDGLEF